VATCLPIRFLETAHMSQYDSPVNFKCLFSTNISHSSDSGQFQTRLNIQKSALKWTTDHGPVHVLLWKESVQLSANYTSPFSSIMCRHVEIMWEECSASRAVYFNLGKGPQLGRSADGLQRQSGPSGDRLRTWTAEPVTLRGEVTVTSSSCRPGVQCIGACV
jgi:hypothetical protein